MMLIDLKPTVRNTTNKTTKQLGVKLKQEYN